MNKSNDHLQFLDAIRGVAILAVFLFHALGFSFGMDQPPWSGWFRDFGAVPSGYLLLLPAALGWCGVAIFFVVSGFCIHLSYERSRNKSIGNFYVRRFFRVYPPYLLALVIFSFVQPWHYIQFDGSLRSLMQFFSHALLVHNLRDGSFYGINPSFWSIAVEFQLYLLYPVLVRTVRSVGWKGALCITGIIEFSLRAFSGVWDLTHTTDLPRLVTGSPFFFWFSWTIGAALADAYLREKPLPMAKCPVWLFPALFVASFVFKPLDSFAFVFAALSTANILAIFLQRPVVGGSWLLSQHMQRAGAVSYSIYLIHQPLLSLVPKAVVRVLPHAHVTSLAMMAICLAVWPVIMLLAGWIYTATELPSIELGKALLLRLGSRSHAAGYT